MWKRLLRTHFVDGYSLRTTLDLARVPATERQRTTALWLL
jgi:hypothetical protein